MSRTVTMTAGTTASAADINQNFDELGVLAYAQVTANQGTFTAETDLTSLTVTVTISSGFATASRKLRIRGRVMLSSSVAGDVGLLHIKEGATYLDSPQVGITAAGNNGYVIFAECVVTPTSGSHTYKLAAARRAGTGNITMVANTGGVSGGGPAFIIAEAI